MYRLFPYIRDFLLTVYLKLQYSEIDAIALSESQNTVISFFQCNSEQERKQQLLSELTPFSVAISFFHVMICMILMKLSMVRSKVGRNAT